MPVGILNHLQNGDYSVQFSPETPGKRVALRQIGYGSVIKILMRWKRPFWKHYIPDAQFIFSDRDIPTWWMQNPVDSKVLTGWVGGSAADDLSELPEKELLEIAVENLSAVFNLPVPELNLMLLYTKSFNWRKEVFYSWSIQFFNGRI